MTPSIDQILHQFANLLLNWTLLPNLTLLPNFGGFHRTLQRVRLANRGRLLLRTPGPVPFGLAFVLMLRPFFPDLFMSTDLMSFKHPSVLLFCCIFLSLREATNGGAGKNGGARGMVRTFLEIKVILYSCLFGRRQRTEKILKNCNEGST